VHSARGNAEPCTKFETRLSTPRRRNLWLSLSPPCVGCSPAAPNGTLIRPGDSQQNLNPGVSAISIPGSGLGVERGPVHHIDERFRGEHICKT
jgi:hypothetical protein